LLYKADNVLEQHKATESFLKLKKQLPLASSPFNFEVQNYVAYTY